jgi:hypothetical protein
MDNNNKQYEKRRIKKLIAYCQGAVEAFSFVKTNVELFDRDYDAIDAEIEKLMNRIEKYNERLKRLPNTLIN